MTVLADDRRVIIRELGLREYGPVFRAMKDFTAARGTATPDEIWLLEHAPVFTLGQASDRSHLLDVRDMPVAGTDRGGEVTYHAPGQAVVYLLFDLKRQKGSMPLIREFVRMIEETIIETLAVSGLETVSRAGAPGIYLPDASPHAEWRNAKIAALGLKVLANGCIYHGFSLNVGMDLQPFLRINPCGHAGLKTVDLKTLGIDRSPKELRRELAGRFCRRLGLEPHFSDDLPVFPERHDGQ